MPIPESLLEVKTYKGQGYSPVVDYGAWRVAVLNYSDELRPQHLTKMQRHNETDEVFVLLQGRCILFIGQGDNRIHSIDAVDMTAFTMYNVKKGVWHTHTLSKDAMVLIVENKDTTYENSPFCDLTATQQHAIVDMTLKLWHR